MNESFDQGKRESVYVSANRTDLAAAQVASGRE